MSLLGQFLRIHEAIYKRSDGRLGHRMLGVPIRPSDPQYDRLWRVVNANNHDRYSGYQQQTSRPIPVVAVGPEQPPT
jgi:F420H(2)-dependent quinone reductase